MSKEQSEELLELHEKAVAAYEDCDFLEMRGYLETLFLEGFIDYLIEQAELVQELEDRHYRQELIDEHIERLEKQNKRYRDIIQDFIEYADDYNVSRVEKYHLRKELEGDSDE